MKKYVLPIPSLEDASAFLQIAGELNLSCDSLLANQVQIWSETNFLRSI